MTEEKEQELKKNSAEILSVVRNTLLLKWPFVGSISMKLNLIPVRDRRVRTAMTDGRNVYFDMAFLSTLNTHEQLFVLSHEVWHVVLMHILRLQNRNMTIWNMATDMEVNHMLSKDGLVAPDNLLFPPKEYEGKSAEEIYEYLLKDMKNQAKNKGEKSKGSSNGKSENENPDGGGNEGGNKDGKLDGQFDKHIFNSQGSDGKSEGSEKIEDKWGEVGYDKDFNPSISPNLSDEIREDVISAAQQLERQRGTLPEHIKRIIDGIVKPEISWKEILAKFITSSFHQGEHRWIPPSRRHVYRDLYLPSKKEDKINVTVAIDTSGSTEHDLPKFFSEIVGLLNTFGSYEMNVIQCDAAVSSCVKYDSNDNPFEMDQTKFKFEGGGGTSFVPVFDYIYDNNIETNCLVYFTDGYGDAPRFPPNYPVLWIVVKNGAKDFCDWGTKVYFKNNV